jgi:hypothetical protein
VAARTTLRVQRAAQSSCRRVAAAWQPPPAWLLRWRGAPCPAATSRRVGLAHAPRLQRQLPPLPLLPLTLLLQPLLLLLLRLLLALLLALLQPAEPSWLPSCVCCGSPVRRSPLGGLQRRRHVRGAHALPAPARVKGVLARLHGDAAVAALRCV